MIAEARRQQELVRRLAGPMTPEVCYAVLQPLVIQFGIPPMGEGPEGDALRAAWWKTTVKALMDLPQESLEFAVDRYIATSKKHLFPNPGTLRGLCEAQANRLRLIAYRLRKAVEARDSQFRRPSEAEKKQVGEMFRGLAGEIKVMPPGPGSAVMRKAAPNDDAVREMIRQGLRR